MLGSSKSASGKQAPISSHPIFPVVVAVWFAALLGIGSLVLPIAIFERIFSISGISAVISAAQAPLGVTARLIIAVCAALAGAAAGLIIARKVSAAQSDTAGREIFRETVNGDDDAVKLPISAHEELGSDSFDDPIADSLQAQQTAGYRGKRRSLAVTDDSGKSEFLDTAPLPGGEPAFDNESYAPFEQTGGMELDQPPEIDANVEPLELEILELDVENDSEESLPADSTMQAVFAMPEAESNDFAASNKTDQPEESLPHSPFPNAPLVDEEFAPPFQSDEPSAPEIAETIRADGDTARSEGQAETGGLAGKPLNELGMVELVERFALALQSRSAETVDVEEGAATPLVFRRSNSAETTSEPSADQAKAMPASFQPFGAIDDADEDTDEDADEIDTDFAGLSLRLAGNHTPVEDSSQKPAETGFSSLLNIKGSPREFVRIDEDEADLGAAPESVVVFPGQDDRRATPAADSTPREPILKSAAEPAPAAPRAFDAPGTHSRTRGLSDNPADANETERALREALEKLQRMSGAA